MIFIFKIINLTISNKPMKQRLISIGDQKLEILKELGQGTYGSCLLYTSPSPRDRS